MSRTTILYSIFTILLCSSPLGAANTDVRLNSLGFLPNSDKRATINGDCTAFNIYRVPAGTVAFSGTVTGVFTDSQTGETQLRIADFSALAETGTYYLDVPGIGRSSNFDIRADVYDIPFIPIFKAMYLWRCGTAVSETYGADTFSHAACHTQDAWADQVGGGHIQIASTKGWHDAGDFNKYTVNAGITVGMMFMAWQQFHSKINSIIYGLPDTAPGYPEYLAELKWETDWLLSMQAADSQVYDKVSEINFCAFIMPEANTVPRYFAPAGTIETATFSAMMAMAARNFQPYDAAYAATCLNAATAAYNYLTSHRTNTIANLTAFGTGNYAGSNADAGRLWAAAEMWETTGDASYLAEFETRASGYSSNYVDVDFDWNNVKNLGMYTYAMSARTGRNATLLTAIRNNIVARANSIVATRNSHPYGRPLGRSYYWGCNGSVARQAMMLQIANQFSANADYLNTALDAIGYLFGRNMHDRSYVTGVGINPPMNPHHRPSDADGITNPWPGYLVGGSPGSQSDPYLTAHLAAGLPPAQYWVDIQDSYASNEVAINWQGALIYAMAGFLGNAPKTLMTVPVSNGGAGTASTLAGTGPTKAGYAAVNVDSGNPPYGTAVFSFVQNDVVVSEVGVPASTPTKSARTFIDHRSAVTAVPGRPNAGTVDISTGLAVVNPGQTSANVTYLLRKIDGTTLTTGHGVLSSGAHFAKFINQMTEVAPDFSLPADFPSTTGFGLLEISSDQALAILALRLTVNERSETLFTSTPVADPTKTPPAGPVFFPQFADGGGYVTSVVLMNTSSSPQSGRLQLFDDNGKALVVNQVGGTANSSFPYAIPAGGAFVFQSDGAPAAVKVGSARLIPDSGTSTPVGSGIFRLSLGGVVVTESGIQATTPTTHARIYVDKSGGHDTGLAITAPDSAGANITVTAFQNDGSTAAGSGPGVFLLAGNGHKAAFVGQLVAGLPEGFTGVLDISSSTSFAALTLRSLTNARGDFLLTTFPVADVVQPAPAPIFFPQIADGGGYTTQFILLGATGAASTTISLFGDTGAPLAIGK